MPRFVIHDHDWPSPHWDVMLESGPTLRSWRLYADPAGPLPVRAEPAPDHRLVYLEYEGPVAGGRGRVVRWDAGAFDWLADAAGRAAVALRGVKLRGTAVLLNTGGGVWEWTFTPADA